jgi:hypothetical protein
MRKIAKNELLAVLYSDYDLIVLREQITLTKDSTNNLMIVEGLPGYGFFRYGLDAKGILRVYPNKMHNVNSI